MTEVLTTDHIASVSLADADKDPEAFAQELAEHGFALFEADVLSAQHGESLLGQIGDERWARRRGTDRTPRSSIERGGSQSGGVAIPADVHERVASRQVADDGNDLMARV